MYVEVVGVTCPLTRLENRYARREGRAGCEESFIEHYVMPIIPAAPKVRSLADSSVDILTGVPSPGTFQEVHVRTPDRIQFLLRRPPRPTASAAAAVEGPRLMTRVRRAVRLRHYSCRTEKAYVGWIKRFIFFNGTRHPDTMGEREIVLFLSDLAVRKHVSASTQNQAFSALLFLYRHVLGRSLAGLEDGVRAKRPERLPVVLSRREVERILDRVRGPTWLVASLL